MVEADESLSSIVDGGTRWDELDGTVDEGTVTGVVGKGIDGSRYSGEILELNVEGNVEISVQRDAS